MVGHEDEFDEQDLMRKKELIPPKSYTSKIWRYFGFKAGDTKKKFTFCTLCDTKLKYCRNTTNLFTHFKGQHPLV